VLPPQAVSFVAEHCTHRPATHAGAAPSVQGSDVPEPRSPLHVRQTALVASQIGVATGHCALLIHPHVFVVVLHAGVVPVHAVPLLAEHCAHAPVPRQAGADDDGQACAVPEPLSPSHASHRLAARSHTGAVRGQLALEVQPQVLLAVLQTGLAPKQVVALVDEHCAQIPLTHAGSAEVGQAAVAAVPLSPLHGTQTLFVELQTGVAAAQFVLSLQPQTLPDATHTGVVPAQAAALVEEHCTHCPPRHAGAAGFGQASDAPEPASPLHGMHVLLARSQMGALDGH
jgi:hypothetical protein